MGVYTGGMAPWGSVTPGDSPRKRQRIQAQDIRETEIRLGLRSANFYADKASGTLSQPPPMWSVHQAAGARMSETPTLPRTSAGKFDKRLVTSSLGGGFSPQLALSGGVAPPLAWSGKHLPDHPRGVDPGQQVQSRGYQVLYFVCGGGEMK